MTAGLRNGCLRPRFLEGAVEELACAPKHYRHCQKSARPSIALVDPCWRKVKSAVKQQDHKRKDSDRDRHGHHAAHEQSTKPIVVTVGTPAEIVIRAENGLLRRVRLISRGSRRTVWGSQLSTNAPYWSRLCKRLKTRRAHQDVKRYDSIRSDPGCQPSADRQSACR